MYTVNFKNFMNTCNAQEVIQGQADERVFTPVVTFLVHCVIRQFLLLSLLSLHLFSLQQNACQIQSLSTVKCGPPNHFNNKNESIRTLPLKGIST